MTATRPAPIRTFELLQPGGPSTFVRRVYCPDHGESFALDPEPGCRHIRPARADANSALVESARPFEPAKDELAPVRTIMRTTVLATTPEVQRREIRRAMLERQISGMPVVDRNLRPLGIVTQTDLLLCEDPEATATTLMSNIPRTLLEDAPIWEAAAILASERRHRLLIVDRAGCVAGLISALDLVSFAAERSPRTLPGAPGPC